MNVPPSVNRKRVTDGLYNVSYREFEDECRQQKRGECWAGQWFCGHHGPCYTKREAIEAWYRWARAALQGPKAPQKGGDRNGTRN